MLKKLFLRPPMGWNSYDNYDTAVNESQVLSNAEVLRRKLLPHGWEYVVVDIQWYAPAPGPLRDRFQYVPFAQLNMDEYSRLIPDPVKFPSSRGGAGFKPLADRIHAMGLKFGIHMMRGIPRAAAHAHSAVLGTDVTADMVADPASISRWNPDMYGVRDSREGQLYYDSLIELYESWGVDFITCDDICNTNMYPSGFEARHEIEMLSRAIGKARRDMVLSLSPGPALRSQSWVYGRYANMWRITDDLWDRWRLQKDMFDRCEQWQNQGRRGAYPDCDMLPLGWIGTNFSAAGGHSCGLTREEQRLMVTLWCIFRSPLMLGADLTRLDSWTESLLTNDEVLSLLDEGRTAHQLLRTEEEAVWVSQRLGSVHIALFNLSDEENIVSVPTTELPLAPAAIRCREVWTDEKVTFSLNIEEVMEPHSCRLYAVL